ncbi:unknown [Clostridium sp. CAG:628]|nr:unknown [Clostridium sp. CAG:628]
MTEFKDVPKSETATDTILAYSASIDVGVTQSYTVEFKYANDESVDQSEDMGKTLSGKLFITEGTINIYAGYEKGTLG